MVIVVSVSIVMLAIIVAVAIINNYRSQFEIVQITNYPKELPSDLRRELEAQLKNVLMLKFDAPEESVIRGEIRMSTYRQDSTNGDNSATFIVDVDDYEQSYMVSMGWSDEGEVINSVLISCPETSLMKYLDAVCKAMYDDSQDLKNVENYPIYDKLPIIVDEFNYAMRSSVHYEIRGYFDADNKLVIVINDYSGGNYNAALEKIRALGYNPDEYVIQYNNKGGEF